ncbi:U6 snRNA phosphodiesterase-like [Anneissia japonica]|uniref:U6 snRNA phosphodiesterase-like n=1 Tax=Anneissia japonica TaxID=1529436 RepID=UPI001425ADF3|nr:U6 snRNA phosphodiesterase-like [Anneissia japonica]
MSGLCALQAYDSSENDSDEDHYQYQRSKCLGQTSNNVGRTTMVVVPGRGADEPGPNVSSSNTRPNHTEHASDGRNTLLPLPDEVLSMFGGDDVTDADKLSCHQGRVRSFPHEEGSWATYVYVPISVTHEFENLVSALLDCIPGKCKMHPVEMFHLSVSRTVTLKYHWIRPFVESVSNRLAFLPQFVCAFGKPHVYVNDESTRSFLSLTISQGVKELQDIVKEVDLALEEFNLPSFYKPASFHVSIGWCLGDISQHLSIDLLRNLERCFLEHFSSKASVWKVNNLCSKIGNKYFTFPLA